MQFLHVKIEVAERDYKRNSRAILVIEKYIIFIEKNLFRRITNLHFTTIILKIIN